MYEFGMALAIAAAVSSETYIARPTYPDENVMVKLDAGNMSNPYPGLRAQYLDPEPIGSPVKLKDCTAWEVVE